MLVVVCYDIQDDRRRIKIHQTLQDYGQWVQYSVFECDLTPARFQQLKARLKRLLGKAKEDSIRFYFLCQACQKRQERLGARPPRENPILTL